jgi:hypothetical protein
MADVKLQPHLTDEWRQVVARHGAALQEHYDGDSTSSGFVDEQGKVRTAMPWERRNALDTRWPEIGAPLLTADYEKLDDSTCAHLLAKIRSQLQRHLSKAAAAKLYESWQRGGARAACIDLAARLAGEQDFLARVADEDRQRAAVEAVAEEREVSSVEATQIVAAAAAAAVAESDPLADPVPPAAAKKPDPLTSLFSADVVDLRNGDDEDEVENQSQQRATKRSRLRELLFGTDDEDAAAPPPRPVIYSRRRDDGDDDDEVIGWPKHVTPRRRTVTTTASTSGATIDDVFL